MENLSLYLQKMDTFMHNDAGDNLFIPLAIIMVFTLFRKKLAGFLITILSNSLKNIETRYKDIWIEQLQTPMNLLSPLFGLFLSIHFITMLDIVRDSLIGSLKLLITFIVFRIIYICLDPISDIIINKQSTETKIAHDISEFIIRIAKFIIVALAIISVLQILGIHVGSFLGGLGLAGMAIALAAKETIANLLGGIIIYSDHLFKIGDYVETDKVHGTVEKIGLRATLIRTGNKTLISIPNGHFTDTAVQNYSKMPHRKCDITIGVEYKATSQQLETIITNLRSYLGQHPQIVPSNEAHQMVHLTEFADSAININLVYFINVLSKQEWLKIKEENLHAIRKIVETEKVNFAFPSQTIFLHQ